MYRTDVSGEMAFLPKQLPTACMLALTSMRAPRSRHGCKYPKGMLCLIQAQDITMGERTDVMPSLFQSPEAPWPNHAQDMSKRPQCIPQVPLRPHMPCGLWSVSRPNNGRAQLAVTIYHQVPLGPKGPLHENTLDRSSSFAPPTPTCCAHGSQHVADVAASVVAHQDVIVCNCGGKPSHNIFELWFVVQIMWCEIVVLWSPQIEESRTANS